MNKKLSLTLVSIISLSSICFSAVSQWDSDLSKAFNLSPKASAKTELLRLASTTNGVASTKAKVMAAAKSETPSQAASELKSLFPDSYAKASWVVFAARSGEKADSLETVSSTVDETQLDGATRGSMLMVMTTSYLSNNNSVKSKEYMKRLISCEPSFASMIWPKFVSNSSWLFPNKDEQISFYNDLLRSVPAIESNSKILGLIKSQLEILK